MALDYALEVVLNYCFLSITAVFTKLPSFQVKI